MKNFKEAESIINLFTSLTENQFSSEIEESIFDLINVETILKALNINDINELIINNEIKNINTNVDFYDFIDNITDVLLDKFDNYSCALLINNKTNVNTLIINAFDCCCCINYSQDLQLSKDNITIVGDGIYSLFDEDNIFEFLYNEDETPENLVNDFNNKYN